MYHFLKNGFIRQLDLYVWEEVCKLLAKMLDDGNYVCPVSVNVSRIDLYDPEIGDAIEQMLEQYNVPKRLLRLKSRRALIRRNRVRLLNWFPNCVTGALNC